jgi:hypothetical protein
LTTSEAFYAGNLLDRKMHDIRQESLRIMFRVYQCNPLALAEVSLPILVTHVERIKNKLESCSASDEGDREMLTEELNQASEVIMAPKMPMISNFISVEKDSTDKSVITLNVQDLMDQNK